jgi:hypothetical protein
LLEQFSEELGELTEEEDFWTVEGSREAWHAVDAEMTNSLEVS